MLGVIKLLNITNDGINAFTVDCDRFLIDAMREYNMYTYLWDMGAVRWKDNIGYIAIRVPGATRGYIAINKAYIITDVAFYDDVCFERVECYHRSIVDYIKGKYIGSVFVPDDVLPKTSTNYSKLNNKLLEGMCEDARG